jgi:hypothetical protein
MPSPVIALPEISSIPFSGQVGEQPARDITHPVTRRAVSR